MVARVLLPFLSLAAAVKLPHDPHPRLHNRTLCELGAAEGLLGEVVCSNWAGDISWTPSEILAPHDEEELVGMVKEAHAVGKKMKVVGLGHSWNKIHHPDPGGSTMTLSHLKRIVIDRKTNSVRVQAGVTFKLLNVVLAKEGLALNWMSGGIQTLTVGGAVSVGYHGSQINVGTFASLTQNIKLLQANGEFLDMTGKTDESDELRAIRTGLGLVGIVVEVTLPITQQFYLKRARWEVNSMAEFRKDHLPKWRDHPRFHWYWHPYTDKVWLMTWEPTTKEASEKQNQPCRTAVLQWEDALHEEFGPDGMPLVLRWDNCSDISYLSYTHADDMRAQPIYNKEYFVPVTKEHEALDAFVKAVRNSPIKPHTDFWVHERYLNSDNSFLMPCYGFGHCSSFEVAYVSNTMTGPLPPMSEWREQTAAYDTALQSFHGRPHWAKENLVDYQYYKDSGLPIDEFMAVRKRLDPNEMFLNDYLREKLLPGFAPTCDPTKDPTCSTI
jgi:FAD/FMN-containing dehydrogenase